MHVGVKEIQQLESVRNLRQYILWGRIKGIADAAFVIDCSIYIALPVPCKTPGTRLAITVAIVQRTVHCIYKLVINASKPTIGHSWHNYVRFKLARSSYNNIFKSNLYIFRIYKSYICLLTSNMHHVVIRLLLEECIMLS